MDFVSMFVSEMGTIFVVTFTVEVVELAAEVGLEARGEVVGLLESMVVHVVGIAESVDELGAVILKLV